MTDRGLGAGLVLLLVGLYIVLARTVGFGGPGPVLLLIGSILVLLSAARRWRGPIAPGAVLVGLGAGLILQTPFDAWMPHWATVLLGLGAGFLLAAALEEAAGRTRATWPIVPGITLVVIALVAAASQRLDLARAFQRLDAVWPWTLVVAGLLLVARALWRNKT